MATSASSSSSSNVLLVIHAPSVPISSERRLPSHASLSEVKQRIELLSGIPVEAQRLSLWSARTDDADSRASLVAQLDTADATLASMGAQENMGLKVEDTRSEAVRSQFGTEEEEKVQKFELDDEAYAQRSDTVLAYKKRNKMGRFAETTGSVEEHAQGELNVSENTIGARCQVDGHRRGTVRFVGETSFAPGQWIGVEYDEPVGKNDGQVGAGPRYFTCRPKYGGFVRPDKIVVGDFPERGLDDDDFDEDEEM